MNNDFFKTYEIGQAPSWTKGEHSFKDCKLGVPSVLLFTYLFKFILFCLKGQVIERWTDWEKALPSVGSIPNWPNGYTWAIMKPAARSQQLLPGLPQDREAKALEPACDVVPGHNKRELDQK